MCGICGVLNFDGAPVSPAVVQVMTDAIAHRGPDGEGVYEEPGVALGHRRLKIIDLSDTANQPMCDASQRYWIVFNGDKPRESVKVNVRVAVGPTPPLVRSASAG
ncbi:MAG: hypothetical protein IID55_07695, partial [Proteobacteria bacterium]|nr:hypothetical protein [Pseudomonadota bacterium]